MDEAEAQRRAREFQKRAKPDRLPVPMSLYLDHAGAKLQIDSSLGDDESGWSTVIKGQLRIGVNGNDSPERQRFTICHEIAHHVLQLASEHEGRSPAWSYVKRSPVEIACDAFAAELLLPVALFKPLVDGVTPSFAFLEKVRGDAEASLMATGSRFATLSGFPCAFVICEGGMVRYAARSTSLRAAGAWIQPRSAIPQGSVTARVCAGERCDAAEEVDPDLWFTDWESGGSVQEQARYFSKRGQALTLLWAEEEEEIKTRRRLEDKTLIDSEYRELDGTLPWPGKRKRR